jgi:hypothetical protein
MRLSSLSVLGGIFMDLLFISITVLFFIVAIAYVCGCEKLQKEKLHGADHE